MDDFLNHNHKPCPKNQKESSFYYNGLTNIMITIIEKEDSQDNEDEAER